MDRRRGTTRGRGLLLLAVFALLLAACDSWSSLGYDASRSGYNPNETTLSVDNVAGLTEAWSAELPDTGIGSSPVVAAGSVFIASGRLRVYSADGSTGCKGTHPRCAPMWVAAHGGTETPAVAGNVVYTTDEGWLYAFDARGITGCSGTPKVCQPLWSSLLGGDVGSPAVANGVVYVGADRPNSGIDLLFAYDATGSTGCSGTPRRCRPLWSSSGRSGATPAVSGGFVYTVAAHDAETWRLWAFDAAGQTGCSGSPKRCAPRWHADFDAVPCNGQCLLTPPSVGGGRVYVAQDFCCSGGMSGSRVYALDAAGEEGCSGSPRTCEPLASASPPQDGLAYPRSPVAVAKGQVFMGDISFTAFDASDLSRQWSGGPGVSSLSVANGVVYSLVIANNGIVRPAAYDAAGEESCSGSPRQCTPLWKGTGQLSGFGALAGVWSPPVVADGTLYVRLGGRLRAYRLAPA